MKKAIYIGAGNDTRPLICYPEIKDFIYIDSQPNNEFGADFYKPFSRPLFKNNMKNHFSLVDFKLIKESENLLEFEKEETGQKVRYYINTFIPYHYDKIKDEVNCWDTLIVSGHNPNNCIMESRNKETETTFIGFIGTYYGNEFDDEDKNTVVKDIYDNKYKFNKYLYNRTKGWYSLYNAYENMDFSKDEDEELNLLPCYLKRCDKNIVIKIRDYYNSEEILNNNFIFSNWIKYVSKTGDNISVRID